MSLEAIKQLRLEGYVPTVVWVLCGQKGMRAFGDGDSEVVVPEGQSPKQIDWRPLVGLHVDLFSRQADSLMLATMAAIEEAKPVALCIACAEDVIGLSDDHERILRRAWEGLTECS